MKTSTEQRDVFAGLRRFVRPHRSSEAQCELCGADIGGQHQHLLEKKTRKVVCGCDACAILFSTHSAAKYYRIPRKICLLAGFTLTDSQWDSLSIPINMAFFCLRTDAKTPTALYPSPAGATESLLAMESWQEIVGQNPPLQAMEPEVECLLVNRITKPHDYYLAPIDECYHLVGLIRSNWRGFSGGTEVWQSIAEFFNSMKARSTQTGRTPHAGTQFPD
jgi:Family of unknown function (DUF5947)